MKGGRAISRRRFIRAGVLGLGTLYVGALGLPEVTATRLRTRPFLHHPPQADWQWLKEARYYERVGARALICTLCPHRCFLDEGARGVCRVRVNVNGTLFTLAYGDPAAIHVDPVEKKPLFHFLPQTGTFSIATAGCNLRCLNCQNWELSQSMPESLRSYNLSPQRIVELAIEAGCRSISYTYSEPAIFFEYMIDTARLARDKGLKNIWVTAGYIEQEPLEELVHYIDAANVDLKGFRDDIYVKLNGAHLGNILNTLKVLKQNGVWLEITNLVVPTWTDDLTVIDEMVTWLVDEGFREVPLHFSRFYPKFKLRHLPPTPVGLLQEARSMAMERGMEFCYCGNVPGAAEENTYCPGCHSLLIRRYGYSITEFNLDHGRCIYCGRAIPGIWQG